jgi:hypothetical protein
MRLIYVCLKKNISSPQQIKNKPSDGELEHAFNLVSMDCTVRTSKTKIKDIEITEADYFIPIVTNQKKQKTIMV